MMFHQREYQQIEILKLKSTKIEIKNSLEDSTADVNRWKKESANQKTGKLKLYSLRGRKKKE